jgi:hypothetical protein
LTAISALLADPSQFAIAGWCFASMETAPCSSASMHGDTVSTTSIELTNGETAMKTFVSALIALSVLAGIAAPASALDAKQFYEHQDREAK